MSPRLLSIAITTKQIFVILCLIYGDIKSYWLFTVLFAAPEMAPTVRNGKMNELRGFQVLSWCNVGFTYNLLLPLKSFSDHQEEIIQDHPSQKQMSRTTPLRKYTKSDLKNVLIHMILSRLISFFKCWKDRSSNATSLAVKSWLCSFYQSYFKG